MEHNIDIGKRIRELRKEYGLNQTDFAKPLGVSYGHISNLEKGKDMPSQSLIKLVAHEYNTSEEWLLEGKGRMITHKPYDDQPSNMDKTNELMIQLDDILCEPPSTIRNLQDNILESIVLLLNVNRKLKIDLRRNHLEILNKMLKNIYTLNAHLIVAKDLDGCTSSSSHKDRIENLMDEIFENFASELEDFANVYISNE